MTQYQKRIHQSTFRVAIWTVVWLLSMALVSFGPTFLWDSNVTITLIFTGINIVCGFIMIRHNVRYLLMLDEMIRKMHLEAMSISLGVGIVFGFAYSLLSANDILPSKMGMSILAVVFSLTYLGSIFISNRRLR